MQDVARAAENGGREGGAEPARGGGSRAHDPSFRIAMAVMAAVCFAAALFLAGPRSPLFWIGLLGPDLALFAGIGAGLERGQLHPRGVPYYNAVHLLVGPFLLAIASRWLGLAWLGGAAAWGAHVFLDRSLGFGLRDRRGFVR